MLAFIFVAINAFDADSRQVYMINSKNDPHMYVSHIGNKIILNEKTNEHHDKVQIVKSEYPKSIILIDGERLCHLPDYRAGICTPFSKAQTWYLEQADDDNSFRFRSTHKKWFIFDSNLCLSHNPGHNTLFLEKCGKNALSQIFHISPYSNRSEKPTERKNYDDEISLSKMIVKPIGEDNRTVLKITPHDKNLNKNINAYSDLEFKDNSNDITKNNDLPRSDRHNLFTSNSVNDLKFTYPEPHRSSLASIKEKDSESGNIRESNLSSIDGNKSEKDNELGLSSLGVKDIEPLIKDRKDLSKKSSGSLVSTAIILNLPKSIETAQKYSKTEFPDQEVVEKVSKEDKSAPSNRKDAESTNIVDLDESSSHSESSLTIEDIEAYESARKCDCTIKKSTGVLCNYCVSNPRQILKNQNAKKDTSVTNMTPSIVFPAQISPIIISKPNTVEYISSNASTQNFQKNGSPKMIDICDSVSPKNGYFTKSTLAPQNTALYLTNDPQKPSVIKKLDKIGFGSETTSIPSICDDRIFQNNSYGPLSLGSDQGRIPFSPGSQISKVNVTKHIGVVRSDNKQYSSPQVITLNLPDKVSSVEDSQKFKKMPVLVVPASRSAKSATETITHAGKREIKPVTINTAPRPFPKILLPSEDTFKTIEKVVTPIQKLLTCSQNVFTGASSKNINPEVISRSDHPSTVQIKDSGQKNMQVIYKTNTVAMGKPHLSPTLPPIPDLQKKVASKIEYRPSEILYPSDTIDNRREQNKITLGSLNITSPDNISQNILQNTGDCDIHITAEKSNGTSNVDTKCHEKLNLNSTNETNQPTSDVASIQAGIGANDHVFCDQSYNNSSSQLIRVSNLKTAEDDMLLGMDRETCSPHNTNIVTADELSSIIKSSSQSNDCESPESETKTHKQLRPKLKIFNDLNHENSNENKNIDESNFSSSSFDSEESSYRKCEFKPEMTHKGDLSSPEHSLFTQECANSPFLSCSSVGSISKNVDSPISSISNHESKISELEICSRTNRDEGFRKNFNDIRAKIKDDSSLDDEIKDIECNLRCERTIPSHLENKILDTSIIKVEKEKVNEIDSCEVVQKAKLVEKAAEILKNKINGVDECKIADEEAYAYLPQTASHVLILENPKNMPYIIQSQCPKITKQQTMTTIEKSIAC